jgi:alkanesulfonate monooxygenase SsuD/methylene tetrahydromethanopterin reductase-like flavin-dependent oxidoreductase (luciferase family)
MRIGLMIEGQEGLTWDRWFRLADAAESLGYEALMRSDHLTSLGGDPRRPALETWTSLAALATRTRRIRFGPLVSPLTFYHPALLSRMAAAVDDLSGGRLDLGIGAGWNGPEHAMFGVPFPSMKERLDRLEGGARVIRALESGQAATLTQPPFLLQAAQAHPRPPRGRFRLVVGGRGEKRTLRVVAEVADEWNVTRVSLAEYTVKRQALADHCAALGRDPTAIARSLMVPLAIGRDSAEVARRIAAARSIFPGLPADEAAWQAQSFLAGAPERVLEDLRRWETVGVERVLLQMLDQDDLGALELFARHVLPRCARGPR